MSWIKSLFSKGKKDEPQDTPPPKGSWEVTGITHPHDPNVHEIFAAQDGYYLHLTASKFVPTKEDIKDVQGATLDTPCFQVTCYSANLKEFPGLTSTRYFGPENIQQAVYVFLDQILDEGTTLGKAASENIHHFFHKIGA